MNLCAKPKQLHVVQQCTTDDLPKHIKGDHIKWVEFKDKDDNCYMLTIHDGSEHPVEFINDRWHLLAIREDGLYYMSMDLVLQFNVDRFPTRVLIARR
jgi:hypothetical protein